MTEPLGRRQVLPYLLRLAASGWRYTVLSFEKRETATPSALTAVQKITREAGISWTPLRYHRFPPVVATTFDALRGILVGAHLGRSAALLQARSSVPALMAWPLAKYLHVPWIFDVRGLVAEEYVDAGHWSRGGLLGRMTSRTESRLLHEADGLVFLTERIRKRLSRASCLRRAQPTAVIPCCVDSTVFVRDEASRARIRRELMLGDSPTLVYSGSLGSWYRLDEMLDFYEAASSRIRGLRFLVLTPAKDLVLRALENRPQIAAKVVLRHAQPDEVPAYLSAADAGICFLGDYPSKEASSPTKYGEYLASGLPVVTNRWTGDSQRLAPERPWIAIDGFQLTEYQRAAAELAEVLEQPEDGARQARELACREFGLDLAVSRYDTLYREVLDR